MENEKLEKLHDDYVQWFLQDIYHVDRLVMAGKITRLIEDIEATAEKDVQKEEESELTR